MSQSFEIAKEEYLQAKGTTGINVALKKWLTTASTTDEVLEIWEVDDDDKLLKWNQVFPLMLKFAKTMDDARAIFLQIEDDQVSLMEAFKKWLELATTKQDIEKILKQLYEIYGKFHLIRQFIDPAFQREDELPLSRPKKGFSIVPKV